MKFTREIDYSHHNRKEEHERLRVENPGMYRYEVEQQHIILEEEQRRIAALSPKELFHFLFFETTRAYAMDFYPENVNEKFVELEQKIVEALNSISTTRDFKQVRRTLISLGGTEDKPEICHMEEITACQYLGNAFFVVEPWGYRGILRYDEREIPLRAPQEANAYQIGAGKLLGEIGKDKKGKYIWSPLTANTKLRPIVPTQKEIAAGLVKVTYLPREFQLVPVKYYHIETRSSEEMLEKKLGEAEAKYKAEVQGIRNYYQNKSKPPKS